MGSVFLTGGSGQSTDQPASPYLQSIPPLDGTASGMENTVNALVDTVRLLAGQAPSGNNLQNATRGPGSRTTPNKQAGSTKTPPKSQQKSNPPRFSEVSRKTEQVTVKDTSNGASLTYTQITQLIMQDSVTGEQWVWNL